MRQRGADSPVVPHFSVFSPPTFPSPNLAFLSSTEAELDNTSQVLKSPLSQSVMELLQCTITHSQPRVAPCMYSYVVQKNVPVF